MKRHIDCNWLVKKEEGAYECCDSRSLLHGKKLTEEDVQQEACEFFHLKERKYQNKANDLSDCILT